MVIWFLSSLLVLLTVLSTRSGFAGTDAGRYAIGVHASIVAALFAQLFLGRGVMIDYPLAAAATFGGVAAVGTRSGSRVGGVFGVAIAVSASLIASVLPVMTPETAPAFPLFGTQDDQLRFVASQLHHGPPMGQILALVVAAAMTGLVSGRHTWVSRTAPIVGGALFTAAEPRMIWSLTYWTGLFLACALHAALTSAHRSSAIAAAGSPGEDDGST